MDFFGVARSARRRGVEDGSKQSAAEVVGNASVAGLLDRTSGRVAVAAREQAAAVIVLMRSCVQQEQGPCGGVLEPAVNGGRPAGWRDISPGLEKVQAQLARQRIPSHVFHTELLSALRHEKAVVQHGSAMCTTVGENRTRCRFGPGGGRLKWPHPLDIIWDLHKSGLMTLSRLLEANETLPAHYFLGGEDYFGAPLEDCADGLIRDMRALALRAASSDGVDHRHEDPPRKHPASTARVQRGEKMNAGPGREEAEVLLADIARHLFDLAYRNCTGRDTGGVNLVRGKQSGQTLSSRAARKVLDRLCCGTDMFGSVVSNQASLQTCLAVLASLVPTAMPVAQLKTDSRLELTPCTVHAVAEDPMAGSSTAAATRGTSTLRDDPTRDFLARQLRLLMASASGQIARSGENICTFEARLGDTSCSPSTLAAVMRHFSSRQFVDVLQSVVRRAVASGVDAKGPLLHKPLLQWETLAPLVRAAAMAHPQETPQAIALLGTELAETSINLRPEEHSGSNWVVVRDHQHGVRILSAALRIVAEADMSRQALEVEEGGLYRQWFQSCFGVIVPRAEGCAVAVADHGEEIAASEGEDGGAPERRRLEALRDAMNKERGAGVLMDALCWSVPFVPASVLEVHRDVLKTRLRASFSGRIRDFLDLAVTRLSDLKGQDEGKRRNACGGNSNDSRNSVAGHLYHQSDTTNREAGFFLRQFQKTGEVPAGLKTAILWQPKSWAKLRKILLAPPTERLVTRDDDGNVLPTSGDVMSEAIGRGQGGLRVEVSLKYRRLLVQQLAKNSLISAKDYDAFKKAFTEYLQGRREREVIQNSRPNETQGASAPVRQLWLLESRLEGSAGKKRNAAGNVASKARGHVENDGLSMQVRLAVLLQEYLPRALVVELGMERSGDDGYSASSSTPSTARATPMREQSQASLSHGKWLARAAHLLNGVLQEWEQELQRRPNLPLTSPPHYSSTNACAPIYKSGNPSPADVAEAVINSVHCCVAAVMASLGQELRIAVVHSSVADSEHFSSPRDARGADYEPRIARKESEDSPRGASSCANEASSFDSPRGRQALRFVRQVVSIAAEVEVLAEALAARTISLLANPSRLDPRQVLSLTYVVASLPSTFHGGVELLLESVVSKTLHAKPADIRSPLGCGGEHAKILATAQFGALYLQSVICLHGRVVIGHSDEGFDTRLDGARKATEGSESVSRRRRAPGLKSGGARKESSVNMDEESTGFAPVALLDFLWWMERRLSFVQFTNGVEWKGDESRSQPDFLALLPLLGSVLRHPLVEEAYRCAMGSTIIMMPPLDRLITLEVAVSDKDFCSPSAKRAFLESVTLGRLVSNSAGGGHSRGGRSPLSSEDDGCKAAVQYMTRSGCSKLVRVPDEAATGNGVEEVTNVWEACAACLFKVSALRRAARRKLAYRDSWARAFGVPQGARIKGGADDTDKQRTERAGSRWMCDVHPAWGEVKATVSDSEGAEGQALLDSILKVMGKLCDLEAMAMSRGGVTTALPHKTPESMNVEVTKRRKVSSLLRAAVRLANESHAVIGGGAGSALVLVAEIAMPAIGGTEGRGAATAALRCLWDDYLCDMRPLEHSVVASLTRIALTWCEGQLKHEKSLITRKECPVMHMLEDLPLLTIEMVRVWPGVSLTVQPAIAVSGDTFGAYSSDGWAVHLSALHRVGYWLVHNLVSGTLGCDTIDGNLWISQSSAPSSSQGTDVCTTVRKSETIRGDGRVPLGSVKIGMKDGNVQQHSQARQPRKVQGAQRTKGTLVLSERVDQAQVDLAEGLRATQGTVALKHCRCREAAADMPRSCAELVVSVMEAAADISITSSRKRHHHAAAPTNETAKKTKLDTRGIRSSPEPESYNEIGNCNSGTTYRAHGDAASEPIRSTSHLPASTAWASGLLRLLYGRTFEEKPVVSGPLCILLQTLVEFLGGRKTRVIAERGAVTLDDSGIDERASISRSFVVSLVVAILRFAPSLFCHLIEPPFLGPTGVAKPPEESVRWSIAVLECLNKASEETEQPASFRHGISSGAWVTAVLSHYSVAWHGMADVNGNCENLHALLATTWSSWEEVVAFVHRQMGEVSSEELRRIPAATALCEVDPLLKQYFW